MSVFRFIQWISEERPVRIYGDGNQERDFTYVEDIARGTILGLKTLGFEVINLGSDRPFKLIEVVNKIETIVGKKAVIEWGDVVVENFRPGFLKRIGFDYEVMRKINPKIILSSISGYGQTGPWVTRRAYAPVVEAEAGSLASQGAARNGALGKDPHSHADVYTGMEAAGPRLCASVRIGSRCFITASAAPSPT